jgi:kinesin family protein 20
LQLNYLLHQLYESEMRCAVIEAETREEVMREMEERMLNMERVFARRLKSEVCAD